MLPALAVDHLAARRDDQRVRHRPRPLLVERLRELVPVLRLHQVVRRGHLLLLQHLQRGVLLLRLVQAEGDELEVPAAVHPVHRDELRQLGHARAAPGRPDVDHQELLRVVLDQLGHPGVVDLAERRPAPRPTSPAPSWRPPACRTTWSSSRTPGSSRPAPACPPAAPRWRCGRRATSAPSPPRRRSGRRSAASGPGRRRTRAASPARRRRGRPSASRRRTGRGR